MSGSFSEVFGLIISFGDIKVLMSSFSEGFFKVLFFYGVRLKSDNSRLSKC